MNEKHVVSFENEIFLIKNGIIKKETKFNKISFKIMEVLIKEESYNYFFKKDFSLNINENSPSFEGTVSIYENKSRTWKFKMKYSNMTEKTLCLIELMIFLTKENNNEYPF